MKDWITKYHDGYIVVGWGSVTGQDYWVFKDSGGNERILLNYGVEPNNKLSPEEERLEKLSREAGLPEGEVFT